MEWNISKILALRQCHRKFYFAYELANFHFTYPVRRKAFELAQSKSLAMWQGSLIDMAFSKKIIPVYQQKQEPDFDTIASETVDIAKKQFEFSRRQFYREEGISKTVAGDDYLILDIHECGMPYNEQDVLEVYCTVRDIILQIPSLPDPQGGMTLHEYLSSSNYLRPDIQYWNYEFCGLKIKPQIDLVRFKSKSVHVIDWKVSESNTSDYSNQLYLAGIVAYHNNKKEFLERQWIPPKMENYSLYEYNLMNGNVKEHPFTKESTAGALDYVFRFRDEQEQLSNNKKWNELDIQDYETTDKKETCMFCKFKPLCIHMIKNKFNYDETEYYKLVQTNQLA